MTGAVLPTAAGMMATMLHIAEETPAGACDRTGCDPSLLSGILDGSVDPALDTLERVANGLDLEMRIRPEPPDGRFSEPSPDTAAIAEYNGLLSAERPPGWKFFDYDGIELHAAAKGIDLGLVRPPWDGTEPAPRRMLSAGECRHHRGGMG